MNKEIKDKIEYIKYLQNLKTKGVIFRIIEEKKKLIELSKKQYV